MKRIVLAITLVAALAGLTACGEPGTLSSNADAQKPKATPEAKTTTEPEATLENTETASTDETTTKAEEANVFIKQKGFSQEEDDVYMGAVLKNNGTAGASDIEVTFNALDKHGDVVATETADVSVVPAGETFNVGADTLVDGEKVHSVEIYADVADSVGPEYGLPEVSRARVTHERYEFMDGGNTEITAQVRNNMDQSLSSLASVYAVMFDASGKVIGGTHTYPERDIRPGRRASIDFPITDFLPEVAKVAVSADNEVSED
jgi:predicted small lipoprotein YifL